MTDTSDILPLEEVSVEVGGRPILHDVSVRIRPGETHVLFGSNGSGRSSLLMAIMGLSRYRVTKGRILFQGQDITHLPVDERASQGIGLMQQCPPSVRGIPLRQLAEVSVQGKDGTRVTELADQLGCSRLLARDVNVGFSGGEIKKAELLQLMAQQPALALVDEPDAGVDLDNIAVVGQALACLVKQPSVAAFAQAALARGAVRTRSRLAGGHRRRPYCRGRYQSRHGRGPCGPTGVGTAPAWTGAAHNDSRRDGPMDEKHEYHSLRLMQGSMNLMRCPDPQAFERANYMRVLHSWRSTTERSNS